MTTQRFTVTMHCPSCEMVLEGLEDLAGIEQVHADYRAGQLDVTYDEVAISDEAILEAIRSEGYEASHSLGSF